MRQVNHPRSIGPRRGYTLLESLMASSILLMIVVAVTGAVSAGQQHAFEAHQRVTGSLAAEELLGRISVLDYAAIGGWNGYVEPVGAMRGLDGAAMPPAFDRLGRRVSVVTETKDLGAIGVLVRGRTIRVTAEDERGRILASLETFVPEPPEEADP